MLILKPLFPLLVLLALLMGFLPSPALAHRMLIEPVEEGKIKVAYEDGRFSRRTEVFIYDNEGKEIYSGKLDAEGYFYYPQELDAVLIVADDGLGHRVEWRVGEAMGQYFPRSYTVFIVLTLFCFIAAIFHYRIKRRNQRLSD